MELPLIISLSKERYDFCKRLGFDILVLTELHNRQHMIPQSELWILSAISGVFEYSNTRVMRRLWQGKLRQCNVTYIPKHTERRPTKLDYCLVQNWWKSSVENSFVQWAPNLHRFGKKLNHGLLATTHPHRQNRTTTR